MIQQDTIPGKEQVEAILERCLFEVYQLKLDIKHVEITLHCGGGERKGILHVEEELDTPIENSLTYLVRG